MSIQGKKIAAAKQAFKIARMVLNANITASKLPDSIRFIITDRARNDAFAMSHILDRTPHQHFNSKGQIDKRKVRRHKRKMGFKPHRTWTLKPHYKCSSEESMMILLGKLGDIDGPYVARIAPPN
tara:strand:+ start:225 stop:599 length:375 start_codon:yes stop_codon:yes gene_type:complete